MRILTVRQPWAWAIIHAGKTVENRTRSLGPYRGPVAIHTGGLWDIAADSGEARTNELRRVMDTHREGVVDGAYPWSVLGAIIGVVDLIETHSVFDCIEQQHDGDWHVCSEWAERTGHHLVLENPRPLHEPIPVKGALGLRRLDASTEARIREAIA